MQVCRNISYIIFFELFLLAATNHLESLEWIVSILAILCAELTLMWMEQVGEKQNEIALRELDYPNPDLLPRRRRQLKKFISILEQQKEEPYAIMISGAWGVGKSSFVKALELELKDSVFVWIRAGSEKSVSDIMLELSEQILKILRENNVLVEKSALIEKYFLAFSGVLEKAGINIFRQIINRVTNNEEDNKNYLNGRLNDLKKTIYLIFDDLDRCSKEYQEKMFKVIRESTDLINCKTIFLVDKSEFLDCDSHYIEKYVSYTLELCEVPFEEILEYFIDDIIKEDLLQDHIIFKRILVGEMKKRIYRLPNEILKGYEDDMLKKIEKRDNGKTSALERREIEKEIDDLSQIKSIIEKNIVNSRKVKNYLKGIKRTIKMLDNENTEYRTEFQDEEWMDGVIRAQFIKYILPEWYMKIKMCNDISEFSHKYNESGVEILFGQKNDSWILEEKKKLILKHILYDLDVADYSEVKSEKTQYLSELKSRPVFKNIMKYLEYADAYEPFNEILGLCKKNEFENVQDRKKFIEIFLNNVENHYLVLRIDNEEFLQLSKRFIEYIEQLQLKREEKYICRNGWTA